MQNVTNSLTPFFGNDGKPISLGRVHFCKPNTSVSVEDGNFDPDYILVKDKDGSVLQQPLMLNAGGRFEVQPFIDDGLDFKMIVEAPTGLYADLDGDSQCWRIELVLNSFSQKFDVEYSGVPYVGSVEELRNIETESDCVCVLGYNNANDFCGIRFFKWVSVLYSENYGTHIRSNKRIAGGCWVCEPEGFVDVRWFGIDPSKTDDVAYRVSQLSQGYKSVPIYFPAGNYYFSIGITFGSLIMERNAFFYPAGDNDVIFRAGYLENRGGKFMERNEVRVLPYINGVLLTSWLGGKLNEFLTEQVLEGIREIVVDSFIQGNVEVTIEGKKVTILGDDAPTRIKYKNCAVLECSTGYLTGLTRIDISAIGAKSSFSITGFDHVVGENTSHFGNDGINTNGPCEFKDTRIKRIVGGSLVEINSGCDGVRVSDEGKPTPKYASVMDYNSVTSEKGKFYNSEVQKLDVEEIVIGLESIQILDGTEPTMFPAILDQAAEIGKKVVLINRNMQQDITFRYYTYESDTRTMTIPTGSAVELMCVDVKTSSSPNLWVAFFGRRSG